MIIEKIKFDLLLDQRNYYFIMMKDLGGFDLHKYWRNIGDVVSAGGQYEKVSPKIKIQHRRLRSAIAYPRGKVLEIISTSKDGTAPYYYDVFGMQLEYGKEMYFALAFPFVSLARDVIDNLLNSYNLRRKCDILKVDLRQLILKKAKPVDSKTFETNIVGLDVVITDDPALSSLSLGGDDPMNSSIYKKYLEGPIQEGATILERCTIGCELQESLKEGNLGEFKQRRSRARMHIDAFGNFKCYLHIDGENLIIIPYLIACLDSLNCLNTVSINPLHRIEHEDD